MHHRSPSTPRAARRGMARAVSIVRALRLLPAGLPHLQGPRRGDGLAARPHRADEGGARRRAAAGRGGAAPRSLPGLPGLRNGLPVGSAATATSSSRCAQRLHAARSRWTRARTCVLLDADGIPGAVPARLAPGAWSDRWPAWCRRRCGSMLGFCPPGAGGVSPAAADAGHGPAPRPRGADDRLRAAGAAPGDHRGRRARPRRQGVEVVVPPDQGCCGALAAHVGDGSPRRTAGRAAIGAPSPPTSTRSSSPPPDAARG